MTADYIDRQCLHCTVIQVPLRLHLSGGETRFSLHSHEKLDSSFWPPIWLWPPAQRPTIWAKPHLPIVAQKDSRGCFRSRQITACEQAHGRQKRKAAQGLSNCTKPCPVQAIEPFLQASATNATTHSIPRSPGWMLSLHHSRSSDASSLGGFPSRPNARLLLMRREGLCLESVSRPSSQKRHPLRSIHQRSSNATSSKITSPSAQIHPGVFWSLGFGYLAACSGHCAFFMIGVRSALQWRWCRSPFKWGSTSRLYCLFEPRVTDPQRKGKLATNSKMVSVRSLHDSLQPQRQENKALPECLVHEVHDQSCLRADVG